MKHTRPPLQDVSEEDMELLSKISKALGDVLPENADFMTLVYIPGGPTGMKVRMCTTIPHDKQKGLLKETLEAMDDRDLLQRVRMDQIQ